VKQPTKQIFPPAAQQQPISKDSPEIPKEENKIISKRYYRGDNHFLIDLEQAFNVIRARTARIDTDRDGKQGCYVEGWSDTDAAAIWLLVNSGIRGNQFTERLLTAKAAEIANKPVNSEWVGETISSGRGTSQRMTPSEFDPALAEDSLAIAPGVAEAVQSRADSLSESLLELDEQGSLHVNLPSPEDREELHDKILTLSPEGAITITFNKDRWRLLKILAVVKDMSPEDLVEEIFAQGFRKYDDPDVISRLVGAIFS
jgi:hypothetical protein